MVTNSLQFSCISVHIITQNLPLTFSKVTRVRKRILSSKLCFATNCKQFVYLRSCALLCSFPREGQDQYWQSIYIGQSSLLYLQDGKTWCIYSLVPCHKFKQLILLMLQRQDCATQMPRDCMMKFCLGTTSWSGLWRTSPTLSQSRSSSSCPSW